MIGRTEDQGKEVAHLDQDLDQEQEQEQKQKKEEEMPLLQQRPHPPRQLPPPRQPWTRPPRSSMSRS